MKRISKISEEEEIAADDFVKDDELNYLIKGEKALLDKRQHFSWDSPSPHSPSSSNKPAGLLSEDIDSLLPDLDLDGFFDDLESPPSAEGEQPLLQDLDLNGVFDNLDAPSLSAPYQSTRSECDEPNEKECVESFDDDLVPFVSGYSDSDLSEEENEPDWLDLAGEADEFDIWASPTFEDIEIEGAVGRTERALQAAMDIGIFFDLDEAETQVIAVIFEENGWSACKIAILRELEDGTSIAELELASEVKKLWVEHYEFYSAQRSHYRILSWPTALKLVNSFAGYPSIEEIEQLLISLYTHWHEDKIQQLLSRTFNEYLIAYLSRVIDGFEYAPEWAIGQESSCVDFYFLPPSTEDLPAIHDFELERALRNVRRNSTWMNEGLCQ